MGRGLTDISKTELWKPMSVLNRWRGAWDIVYIIFLLILKHVHACFYFSDPSEHKKRRKRETVDVQACNLFMQSDTMLWDRMTKAKDSGGLGYVSI